MGQGCKSLFNGKHGWLAQWGGHMQVGDGSSAHGNSGAGFHTWGNTALLEIGGGSISAGNKGGDWSQQGGQLVRA
jgi:hypothetical protein